MLSKKCLNCHEAKRCQDSLVSWIFFLIGLIATIAIRVVTLLDAYKPLYGKLAWYVGVLGFFIFFVYKFKVDRERSKIIETMQLNEKLKNKKELSQEDYKFIEETFCALSSKKDQINYFFIFSTSILAFILALYFDFFRK